MIYDKIQTLFKRDANNIIIPTEFTTPEFDYLKDVKWETTEKIDGTNMRIEIHVTNGINTQLYNVTFKGRTDNANIPTHLDVKMHQLFDSVNWNEVFPNLIEDEHITIYGEGYGYKIQKGGNYIPNDVNFILFDVKINDWWLSRENLEDIAKKLNINIVPFMGYMTIPEAIEFVKKGFKSTIADNKDYDAEGLVLKTPCGLLMRNGKRLITKIKTGDFIKFKNKYGDNPSPIQPINTKYNG